MASYRTETVVSPDGKIVLNAEPFRPGDRVEVAVTGRSTSHDPRGAYPLRGKPVLRYDRPFDPVADNDWEAGG